MSTEPCIWVVDDDRAVRFVLSTALREAGHSVADFDSTKAALDALDEDHPPALLFTDVRMPGNDGLALLERLKTRLPQLPVIVMSAYTDIATTAGAFRGGAWDYLSKPFDLDHAVALAQRALAPLESTDRATREGKGEQGRIVNSDKADPNQRADARLLGDTAAMRTLFRSIGRLAQLPLSVLVTGETGTGKELVARALHRESPRARNPFIALNTAAIPSELLESELFGHEAGAFTGAIKRHTGRFEQADGGTLFLDEIGDMPLPLQTRLLRVLAEDEFFRVGGRELIKVDVRVIAATHQPLETLVANGRFRADLLHRLDVVRLPLPPLRERSDDVSTLAAHFLAIAAERLQAPVKRITRPALERLHAYDWPGNVRELENLCWRMAALAPGDSITDADIVAALAPSGLTTSASTTTAAHWEAAFERWARQQLGDEVPGLHDDARRRMERVLFATALEHTAGHKADAAARLGLGRNTLTRRLGAAGKRH